MSHPMATVIVQLWRTATGDDDVTTAATLPTPDGPTRDRLVSTLHDVLDVPVTGADLDAGHSAEALAEVVSARRHGTGPARETPAGPRPATAGETSLWLAEQATARAGVHHAPFVVRVREPVDTAILEEALGRVVAAHPALRTTFELADGTVRADVIDAGEARVEFLVEDHRGDEDALRRRTREVLEAGFALDRGPLLRVLCAAAPDGTTHLVCSVHHIVFDAASAGVFLGDWSDAYRALRAGEEGRPATRSGPPERCVTDDDELADLLDHWEQHLAGPLPVLDLPTDRPRPATREHDGDTVRFDLPAPLVAGLRERAAREGLTPFMLVLAAYAVLLHKHSRQPEVLVGTPASLRDRPELADVVGYLVNPVTLRCALDPATPLADLYARVREEVSSALARRRAPFDRVVERVAPARDASHAPLFQTMLVMPDSGVDDLGAPLDDAELDLYPSTTARYDLTLVVEQDGPGLRGVLEYDTALFDRGTAEGLADRFVAVLRCLVDGAAHDVGDVSLLDEAERDRLVRALDPGPDDVGATLLTDEVERWARATPDAPAVISDDGAVTHRELHERAERLATVVRAHGAGPGHRVAVACTRSVEAVVAVLAVLRSGAAYVPVDPAYPRARVEHMLGDSGAHLVLATPDVAPDLPATTPVVLTDEVPPDPTPTPNAEGPRAKTPRDEAYVVYTSGSTGTPKGVPIVDATVTNLVRRQAEFSGEQAAARTLQFMSLSFDVSVMEILGSLAAGGAVVLTREGDQKDPDALLDILERHEVARVYLPYVAVAQLAVAAEESGRSLPALREVASVGEQMVVTPRLRAFAAHRPWLRMANMYGPSETHLSAAHLLPADPATWSQAPPVGHAVRGLRMLALDERNRVVPAGVPAELVIGRDLISPGYVGLPEQTARRFVPDPYAAPDERGLMYRTGDLVSWTPADGFAHRGRIDEQIKVRGFRIEPGEVEAALDGLPGVRASAVRVHDVAPGDRRLVAHVVGDGRALDEPAVRAALARQLPEHLVPSRVVLVDHLPTTPSGKIDRAALAPPDPAAGTGTAAVAPRTPTEQRVAALWAELLGVERLGVDDDFFAVGGHSLLAGELVRRVRAEFASEVTLRSLIASPTVAAMAALLDDADSAGRGPDLDADAVLPDTVRVEPGTSTVAPGQETEVLVTGATGFLGIHLVRDLLDRTGVEYVHCLVRGAGAEEAGERLRTTARRYEFEPVIAEGLRSGRVRVHVGDVARPLLGLDDDAHRDLAGRVDAIHHAAAHINFVAPYASVRATNVDGLVHVLELATRVRPSSVHHMSTVGVFDPRQNGAVVTEADEPTSGAGLTIGYTQSKWVAERVARLAQDRGVPLTVYRIGRVFADSRTGACQPDDFLWRQIRTFRQLGSAPADSGPTNVLPVDHVSHAVVALSRTSAAATRRTFHLVHPEQTAMATVHEALRQGGDRLELRDEQSWLAELETASQAGTGDADRPALAGVVPLFREGALDVGALVYAQEETGRVLAALGLTPPDITPAYFRRVIEFFDRTPAGDPEVELR